MEFPWQKLFLMLEESRLNNDKASLIGLTIQEVAKHAGLSAHTLRYYEKIGLIAPISRSTACTGQT